jgi:hypothetical protein
VRPAALAVAGVEFKQKLSSFCTSLNILSQRGVSTHTAAMYISIFVKFYTADVEVKNWTALNVKLQSFVFPGNYNL